MLHLIEHNLMFFIPLVLAGFLLCGEAPVASKAWRGVLRACGATCGALLALLVLEVLPVLI